MDKPTVTLKTLYFNEGDYNFYQVLEAPNPDGTTV